MKKQFDEGEGGKTSIPAMSSKIQNLCGKARQFMIPTGIDTSFGR